MQNKCKSRWKISEWFCTLYVMKFLFRLLTDVQDGRDLKSNGRSLIFILYYCEVIDLLTVFKFTYMRGYTKSDFRM